MSNIGEIIRTMRMSRGMSQAQLAELVGMRRSAIGNYEHGIREPDLDTIEALADAFNVSLADLMGSMQPAAPDDPLEAELVAIYRSLNAQGQEMLVRTARSYAKDDEYKKGGLSSKEMA